MAWGRSEYTQFPKGNWFVDIDAGGHCSLALKSDGSIATWGYGLGIPLGWDFVAISAGSNHSLALKDRKIHEC